MTGDSRTSLARAIVLASVLVTAGLFWLGWRVGERSTAPATPVTQADPTAPEASTSPAPAPGRRASDTGEATLERDAFDAAWLAEAEAAAACWTEATTQPPVLHFFVVVKADGSVADVSFRQPLPEGAQELFLCAARVVKGLRLEPSAGVRKGEIQLMQPGVSVVVDP
jgi:hypothetical protein